MSHAFFFFNDTATTEIYTLSLHDALPISEGRLSQAGLRLTAMRLDARGAWEFDLANRVTVRLGRRQVDERFEKLDRKSTRLNSSHSQISYAVFCLKKKKKQIKELNRHVSA